MKKIAHILLLVGIAGLLAVQAQTNAPVTSATPDTTNTPPMAVVDTNAAPAMTTNVMPPAPDAPATNTAPADATAAPGPGRQHPPHPIFRRADHHRD